MSAKSSKASDGKESRSSTSCDSQSSSSEKPVVFKTNALKHKTELCKTYSELGHCNYGTKCRFAHGRDELQPAPTRRQFRQKKCNGFWKSGCCQYGIRCQFGHAFLEWEDRAVLFGLQAHVEDANPELKSKLLSMLTH